MYTARNIIGNVTAFRVDVNTVMIVYSDRNRVWGRKSSGGYTFQNHRDSRKGHTGPVSIRETRLAEEGWMRALARTRYQRRVCDVGIARYQFRPRHLALGFCRNWSLAVGITGRGLDQLGRRVGLPISIRDRLAGGSCRGQDTLLDDCIDGLSLCEP